MQLPHTFPGALHGLGSELEEENLETEESIHWDVDTWRHRKKAPEVGRMVQKDMGFVIITFQKSFILFYIFYYRIIVLGVHCDINKSSYNIL
jgi:hypothetical protein